MAGTILQRILSRSKMTSPIEIDAAPAANTSKHLQQPTDTSRKTSISFDNDQITFSKEVPHRSLMANPRKQSYASVREEADTLQAFRTRSLAQPSPSTSGGSSPRTRRSTSSSLHPFLDEDVLNEKGAWLADDVESVVIDDDSETCSIEEERASDQPASLESLPDEILDDIFSRVQLDATQDSYLNPRVDLFSCLLVSKPVHEAALRVLYDHVTISRSKTFHKFVTSLVQDARLGKLVHTLDFSHYSQMGYGRSRGQTNTTPYLTSATLNACLSRTPNLKAFLIHEHLDDEIDSGVLSKLLNMPSLRALDLCSCNSEAFTKTFLSVCADLPREVSPIKRLSLHECATLKPKIFEQLLPTLSRVTHLDLAHTQVNDRALFSIPHTARITHLNLERCTQLTGSGVVRFLTTHPAVKDSLVYLNVMADASRYRLLAEDDINHLLPYLPETLRSLNLGGARVNSTHVQELRRLATQLEELGLRGANLSLNSDINQILSLPPSANTKLDHPEWTSSVRYIDLTDVASVTQMSLTYSPVSLRDERSMPLEVIELGGSVLTEISKRSKNVKNPDWIVRELGRRGWYVRQPSSLSNGKALDHGFRSWKMGARWWGMRKIPVLNQEVGGMYGYFMFKRN